MKTGEKVVISSSYGNDSIALIQFLREKEFDRVPVVFIDTGWSAPGWLDRVSLCEEWVQKIGFESIRIKPEIQFEELMMMKKGFPSQQFQWCSGHLKGIPFLGWIDSIDPSMKYVVAIGKRREESLERADTPEFVDFSEYHGGRKLWHPLFMHCEGQRNSLVQRAGFDVLPHRSKECSPCVNANKGDFRRLDQQDINKVSDLESRVGKNMFRSKKTGGANGIIQVIEWAHSRKGRYNERQETLFNSCSSGYCGF